LASGFNVSGTVGSSVPLGSDGFYLLVCDVLYRHERLDLMLCAACSVIGFVLCTIPKIHYQVILVSTAIVGSTAVILGVDCFSTAGLKEVRIVIPFIRSLQKLNILFSFMFGISASDSSFQSLLITTFSFPLHSPCRSRSVLSPPSA
jgi:hypothetical protein